MSAEDLLFLVSGSKCILELCVAVASGLKV